MHYLWIQPVQIQKFKVTGEKSVYSYKIQQILVKKIKYISMMHSYIQLQKNKDEVGGFSNFHMFQSNLKKQQSPWSTQPNSNRNLHLGVAVLHLTLQLCYFFLNSP